MTNERECAMCGRPAEPWDSARQVPVDQCAPYRRGEDCSAKSMKECERCGLRGDGATVRIRFTGWTSVEASECDECYRLVEAERGY